MQIKYIKKLAKYSFIKGDLSEEKVNFISRRLNKQDLKAYIKALKLNIEKDKVEVFTATKLDKKTEFNLKNMFKDKKIEFKEDKELLAGIKIKNYDTIYESNLKNTLNLMVDYIQE